MKQLIKEVAPYKSLYRDTVTGIAWIEDGSAGVSHSAHPNIAASGSIDGMKRRGYWSKEDRTVESHGFIYNIDQLIVSDELDEIARLYCQCWGNHKKYRTGLSQ